MLTGAAVVKTYWKKEITKKTWEQKETSLVILVLPNQNEKTIQSAIDRAGRILDKKTDDPATKENVKSAINEAKDNFKKIMGDKTIRG